MSERNKKNHRCDPQEHTQEGITRRHFLGAGLTSIIVPSALIEFLSQQRAMADIVCSTGGIARVGYGQMSYDQGPYWNMFAPVAPNGQTHAASDITRYRLKWGYADSNNFVGPVKGALVNASDAWGRSFLNGPMPTLLNVTQWASVLQDVTVSLSHVNRNDDGGGQVEPGGALGVIGLLKSAQIKTNFNFANNLTAIQFASQFSALRVQRNVASMAQAVTFPAPTLTSEALMRMTVGRAEGIGALLNPLRKGKYKADKLGADFACALRESPAKAAATFGSNLFAVEQLAPLINQYIAGANVTGAQLAALPATIQSTMMAAYRSSLGDITSFSMQSGTGDEHAVGNGNREANRISAAQHEAAAVLGFWLGGTGILGANGAGSAGGSSGFTNGANGTTTPNDGNDNGSETTIFHTLIVKRGSGGMTSKHLGYREVTNGNTNRSSEFGASVAKAALSQGILFAHLANDAELMAKIAALGVKAGLLRNTRETDALNPLVG